MQSLFNEIQEMPPAAISQGPLAGVAMEQSLDQVLDYAIPPRLQSLIQVGQRVRVPLGRRNRLARGYVVSIHPTSDYPKIKNLLDIDDARVLVPPKLMDLSRWMSRYYCTPLGMVLESVIPSAVKKKIGVGYSQIVRLIRPREEIQTILEKTRAPKRRSILARLLLLEPEESIELVRLAGESGATLATVRKLAALGLIAIRPEVDLTNWARGEGQGARGEKTLEAEILLNEDQQTVLDELSPRIAAGGFSVNLLHGVTGSGKTEIYLRCIRQIVDGGRQAIVLVPEIALTPQTVRRFTARFKSVAILHSGLTATQRHRFWQQTSLGEAQVVVGARSAVFAPLPNLGMIVVDEEHEASYKQDTAPRYHGRDVAIKRAQLENIPVLLGSATPSLEMYYRVSDVSGSGVGGRGSVLISSPTPDPRPPTSYHLLSLPRRVRGLSMPHVELIDMKQENRFRRGVHLLSQRLEHLLRTTIESGHQAILLLNRRGYSNFVYCPSCQNVIQCKYCDATMTYHRSAATNVQSASLEKGIHTGQLHCHYCLAVNPLPEKCPDCGKKLSLFGLGTQRVEEEITKKFPDLTFARVDSDTMRSSKDYENLLDRFARREIQVMLGTQMIAKGLDYPNVTLVGVISGDTALALPDFRAAERTFQLITQVAGRAGRGDSAGRVVLQTFLPDDPTIQAAIRQDFPGFAKTELKSRREVGLPPFTRMVRIILRDQDQEKLHKRSEELAAKLIEAVEVESQKETDRGAILDSQSKIQNPKSKILLKGPMPCPISRIAGYYRNQMVMFSPRAERLQQVLAMVRKEGSLAKCDRIAVDVDPVSLL